MPEHTQNEVAKLCKPQSPGGGKRRFNRYSILVFLLGNFQQIAQFEYYYYLASSQAPRISDGLVGSILGIYLVSQSNCLKKTRNNGHFDNFQGQYGFSSDFIAFAIIDQLYLINPPLSRIRYVSVVCARAVTQFTPKY